MFSVSLVRVKLLTILSMVCMGLFSRFVLGFPFIFPIFTPTFNNIPENYKFPDSGSRTSLRFLPASRYTQKRRRALKDGRTLEEELTLFQPEYDDSQFDFIGEVVEQGGQNFNATFNLTRH